MLQITIRRRKIYNNNNNYYPVFPTVAWLVSPQVLCNFGFSILYLSLVGVAKLRNSRWLKLRNPIFFYLLTHYHDDDDEDNDDDHDDDDDEKIIEIIFLLEKYGFPGSAVCHSTV